MVQDTATEPKTHAEWVSLWSGLSEPSERHAWRPRLPVTPAEVMGCRFVLHPADNFTELCMWESGLPPEHAATEFIAEALDGLDPVIVDVGANAGAFFLPIHLRGGRGTRSIVFEPNPDMRARLVRNIALNGFDGSVHVFDCAVSDRVGRSALYFPRNGNQGQGRIDVAYPHRQASMGVAVDVRPLLECLLEVGVPHVDFLKVDVEGLEDRVIVPLLESNAALRPKMIYFETVHDGVWSLALMETLEKHGYDLIEQFDKNALFLRDGKR